ncbi:bifunctional UDP-N-acetylglucosamine diphosphorylase/glucosamine-1-phosphate N-acetyltransferase GlmU, partial [Staphylococcus pseudintermedius]
MCEGRLRKVRHPLGSAPLLHHAMQARRALDPVRTVIVTGHGADLVEKAARAWDPDVEVVLQAEQLGTGHAVAQAAPLLAGQEGDAVVRYSDTPFIRAETLEAMQAARSRHAGVVMGFHHAGQGRYGRLVTTGDDLDRIVEYKDASDEERAITLCNSGVICADAKVLLELVAALGNDNASGEYYLTDIVEIARQRGLSAGVVTCDEAETLGINTRAQLAAAEAAFQS